MNWQPYQTFMSRKQLLTGLALLASLTICLIGNMACISEAQTRAAQKKSAPAKETPRYKAIWEPINYKEDVQFTDVFFVNDKVGWASGSVGYGKGAFILHTRDGAESWTIQLGDLQSSEHAYRQLRFVDEKHGFAAQPGGAGDHKLLRTTDGQSWEVSGTVPQHRGDYTFISPSVGVASTGNEIIRTQDAGGAWKNVFTCEMKVEVEGLVKNTKCSFSSIHFPSPNVGYAIGRKLYVEDVEGLYVARTENGGASWRAWLAIPKESGHEGDVFFTDENTGFVRVWGGRFYATADGGQTWRGIAGTDGSGKPEIKFADRLVGWAIGPYGHFNYTADGGKRWVVRQIKFPTQVSAFSLPSRNRGYVVGEHGMIFRYRIVPADFTVKGMIDAPIMPGG